MSTEKRRPSRVGRVRRTAMEDGLLAAAILTGLCMNADAFAETVARISDAYRRAVEALTADARRARWIERGPPYSGKA